MTALKVDERSSALLPYILRYVDDIVKINDAKGGKASSASLFQCVSKPSITLENYLERIMKYNPASYTVYIQALIYLERIAKMRSNLILTSLTVHRLFLTAVCVSTKYLEDKFYNNKFFAKLGGVFLGDINQMELDFLFLIEFELEVGCEEFKSFEANLLQEERTTKKFFNGYEREAQCSADVISYLGMGRRKSMTTLQA